MFLSVGVCSVVIASLSLPVLSQQTAPAKKAAPKKAASMKKEMSAGAPTGPTWLAINVVRVKADMTSEYEDFVKKEAIPTLKKGGVKGREAWGTGVFGEAFEIVYVTPIESFARYDSPSPIVKALGEEGARSFGAKQRKFIVSSHTYGVQIRPDLSLMGDMSAPPKLAIINSIHTAPGKGPAFESLLTADVLPAVKKAGVKNYLVSQTVFGGDPNEYVTLTLIDNFAELDKGSPLVRGMGGQAAFNRWLAKVQGVVASQERSVARYLPDLSFSSTARADNK